jgi:hypothetical protein
MTPTVSTFVFSGFSIVFYVGVNFLSHGNVISDSITAATFFVAIYLGISAAACAWHFRASLTAGWRPAVSRVIVPGLAAFMFYGLLAYNVIYYGRASNSYMTVDLPLFGNVGGTEVIGVVTALLGFAALLYCRVKLPAFFTDKSRRYGPSLTEEGQIVSLTPEFDQV